VTGRAARGDIYPADKRVAWMSADGPQRAHGGGDGFARLSGSSKAKQRCRCRSCATHVEALAQFSEQYRQRGEFLEDGKFQIVFQRQHRPRGAATTRRVFAPPAAGTYQAGARCATGHRPGGWARQSGLEDEQLATAQGGLRRGAQGGDFLAAATHDDGAFSRNSGTSEPISAAQRANFCAERMVGELVKAAQRGGGVAAAPRVRRPRELPCAK